ncbi:MAG: DUF1045 domain-containing protein [Polymorphobacter sp.]|uniref:DUF1045 domain-containing protein n=1 Tax=Polymorphobacter sp. TaxID=1909290 RepID=UPI003A863E14
MSIRYAVYYAPPAAHPLSQLASQWLGRDAWTGATLARPPIAGLDLDGEALDALTAAPRGYGFHATLKAPFALAEGCSEADLLAAVARLATATAPFDIDLQVASLSGFIALTPRRPSDAMVALHTACVRDLDALRAPLSEADLARRRRAPMTPEQDARMVEFGYPWIFEDFRFHMTLTGRITDSDRRAQLVAALAAHLAPATGLHHVDQICVFRQDSRDTPMHIIQASPFQPAS